MMGGILVVAIIFGGLVLALAVIGGTILIAIRLLRGDMSRKGQRLQNEEAKTLQEIHQGLERMERRIEALETIVFEPQKEERHEENG